MIFHMEILKTMMDGKKNDTRKNIAELGIGCNPKAVVTGNVLEDEKVGLHIAYVPSKHFG